MKKVGKIFLQALLFLIAVTFLCSCFKEKKKEPVYIDQQLKTWFNYQPGSYWIFYDSLNKELDSLYVTSTTDTQPFQYGIDEEKETREISMDMVRSGSAVIDLHWSLELVGTTAGLSFSFVNSFRSGFAVELIWTMPPELKEKTNSYTCTLLPTYNDGINNYNLVYSATTNVNDTLHSYYHNTTFYFNHEAGVITGLINSTFINKRLYALRHKIM